MPKTHPLNDVRWVDPKTLHANSYNPNHVFKPEMALLKRSILKSGWTQPIVALPNGQIVDGFHRWTLASTDKEIQAVSDNLCPVVYLPPETERAEQLAATVRHNRARGKHGVLRMGEVVSEMSEHLGAEEVQAELGMDEEEFSRLSDTRGANEKFGKDSFGRGWIPVRRKEVPSEPENRESGQ